MCGVPDPEPDECCAMKEIMKYQRHTTARPGTSILHPRSWMLTSCMLAAVVFTGCTLDPVGTSYVIQKENISRPTRILVPDFAVIPADIPPDAPIGARLAVGASLDPEQV